MLTIQSLQCNSLCIYSVIVPIWFNGSTLPMIRIAVLGPDPIHLSRTDAVAMHPQDKETNVSLP